jgi:hypothetical protein
VHERHLGADVGEVQRFLDRGVAAAHDDHVLTLEEKAVAGRAGGHPASHVLLLRGQAKIPGGGAGGDHQGVAAVARHVAFQHERALAQARGMDLVGDHFGLEALGVLLEALHQVRSLDALGVGRPVIHIGRGHELAALRHAGDQHRPQVCPRRVDRGGITRRAGAENQEPGMPCRHSWKC